MNNMNNESALSSTGAAAALPPRKFQDLISAGSGLYEISEHLRKLGSSIGIVNVSGGAPVDEPVKQKSGSTLISMLNDLPNEIRKEIEVIHSMITEIENQLN